MNEELWGVGRTFILVCLGLVGAIVLAAFGKIPGIISLTEWGIFVSGLCAIFAAKSVGHAFANKKGGNGEI